MQRNETPAAPSIPLVQYESGDYILLKGGGNFLKVTEGYFYLHNLLTYLTPYLSICVLVSYIPSLYQNY